jgi:hypothetical protein
VNVAEVAGDRGLARGRERLRVPALLPRGVLVGVTLGALRAADEGLARTGVGGRRRGDGGRAGEVRDGGSGDVGIARIGGPGGRAEEVPGAGGDEDAGDAEGDEGAT